MYGNAIQGKSLVINDYRIDNISLMHANEFKDLGILFAPALNFEQHIVSVVNKAYRNLGFLIRQSGNLNSISALKLLYFTLLRSKLQFSSPIWSPHFLTYMGLI